MVQKLTTHAATDWRNYAVELRYDPRQIEQRLGRSLTIAELSELEDMDDVSAALATEGEPSFDAFEVMTEYGYPLERPDPSQR